MSVNGGEEVDIALTNQDRALTPEPNIGEVQRRILERALQILEDPQAITLTYPNKSTILVANHGIDPDYEHGSQIRFVMLKNPKLWGRDEVCVAVVNNTSKDYPVNLGAGLEQFLQGKRSEREIAVVRFTQTPLEELKGVGIATAVAVSDTDPTFTGTFSRKGTARANRIKPDTPTFAQHWQLGNAQLTGREFIDVFTNRLDFTSQDYIDILAAVNKSRIDPNLTDKVVKSEDKMSLAKVIPKPIDIKPHPQSLQSDALKG